MKPFTRPSLPLFKASLILLWALSPQAWSASSAVLFNEKQPLSFTVTSDFTKLMGEIKTLSSVQAPEEREKVRAQVVVSQTHSNQNVNLNVHLKIRGMTSPAELDFAKLSMEFDDPNSANNTPFAGLKKLSIGTHGYASKNCDQISNLGRLHCAYSVLREAQVYRLLEAMKIPVRQTRLAKVTYIDTNKSLGTWPAVLLETNGAFAKRLGGKAIDIEAQDYAGNLKKDFSEVDLATLALTEILLGNWDFSFPTYKYETEFHNMAMLDVPGANGGSKKILVPEDFDMASIVTGVPHMEAKMPATFLAGRTDLQRVMAWSMKSLKSEFSLKAWNQAMQNILAQEPTATYFAASLKPSDLIDDPGIENFKTHVQTFFALLKESAK